MKEQDSRQLFKDLCLRLHDNVAAQSPDLAEEIVEVAADAYRSPERFSREQGWISRSIHLSAHHHQC